MHPHAQQMIRKVEELSGKPVHVAEDQDMKVMASIGSARVLRELVKNPRLG